MDLSPDSNSLDARLLALHQASLELVQEMSLEALLQRIVDAACQQAGARYAALGVLNENGDLQQFLTSGMPPEEIARMAHPPRGLGLIGALMHSHTAIRIPDISADRRRVGFPRHHPPMRSFLGVPIRHSGRQLGQLYITEKIDAAEFTLQDQQVIEVLAAYAAVAIHNAHLYNNLLERDRALTRRNQNLALLTELASTLASASEIDEILTQSIPPVMDSLHLEVGEVFLRQGESRILSLTLHRSVQVSALWKKSQFMLGEGPVGQAAQTGQSLWFDLQSLEAADLHPDAQAAGLKQVACFPITGRQGPLGVFCIATTHETPLDELETQFMLNISAWMGTALENAHLSLQSRRLAVLEERERFGMDLHDGVIQSIYGVGLTLEHARLLINQDLPATRQRIEQAIGDLNSTISDIRSYILDLRPRQLHDDNLMQGLERLVHEFQRNRSIPVSLQGPSDGFPNMTDAQALTIFHICQEALANIAKHAHATAVEVVVWKAQDRVLLEVHDNGRGFDPDQTRQRLGHGLSNMLTRALNVGGEVDISSEPGNGSTILAWVPYLPDDDTL